ncbi:MAG: sporulation protein [Saprospiraceae bacterium]
MLGKVKKWLGIEGVKLELDLPPTFDLEGGRIEGRVRLFSKNAQTVTAVRLVLIERYRRGRGEEQLVDEYELGRFTLTEQLEVPAEGEIERAFSLPFSRPVSEVDEFGQRNAVFGGLAWAARKLRNVSSEYRLEAEAQVRGVALNPFDRQELKAG